MVLAYRSRKDVLDHVVFSHLGAGAFLLSLLVITLNPAKGQYFAFLKAKTSSLCQRYLNSFWIFLCILQFSLFKTKSNLLNASAYNQLCSNPFKICLACKLNFLHWRIFNFFWQPAFFLDLKARLRAIIFK